MLIVGSSPSANLAVRERSRVSAQWSLDEKSTVGAVEPTHDGVQSEEFGVHRQREGEVE